MYSRLLTLPNHSFFLLGPRSTGKSTWLRKVLPNAQWFDLLRTGTVLNLSRNPELFREQVLGNKDKSWVVIDEIQKMPSILNEVQAIMTEFPDAYKFALSGSSARKLKQIDANLLAGRAINKGIFPLTGAELEYNFNSHDILMKGSLPQVCNEPDYATEILNSYVDNYIKEEIQQEAITRSLDSFVRFLEIVSIVNTQIVNMSSIARECTISRNSVERYFDILTQTLIGSWLPAWKPRAKVKEYSSPKFYLFDSGVAHTLAGRNDTLTLDSSEKGALMETIVLNELRAHIEYSNCKGNLSYWRSSSKKEIDFIWSKGEFRIGIEVKSSTKWRNEYDAALREMLKDGFIHAAIGIYLGNAKLQKNNLKILPLKDFMKELHCGEILKDNS